MDSKKIGAAIVKKDSTENWSKAKNYIPPVGTIIMMENDDKSIIIKFGDGKTLVNDLPNLISSMLISNAPTFYEEDELLEFK